MKIAYIINSIEGGGAQSPLPAIIDVMRGAGAEVRLFALARRDGRAIPALVGANIAFEIFSGSESDHLGVYRWLVKRIEPWRPSLIWTSLTRATLIGQFIGANLSIPVVSWQHAAFLKPWNRRLLRLRRHASALWVADSETVVDFATKQLGIADDHIVQWPIFAADPHAPQAVAWHPGEILRLGSLGRLHPIKGYQELFAAMALLNSSGFVPPTPFTLTIAGDGEMRSEMESQIDAHGLTNVTLTGYTADPAAFVAGLNLYVQPSHSEGFCVAAHEAMQAGLPVIASAVGQLAHSITPDNGWLVPPSDPVALAEALKQALDHPERLGAMGATGRAMILERYSRAAFAAAGAAIIARFS